jgi:hypothetical protein
LLFTYEELELHAITKKDRPLGKEAMICSTTPSARKILLEVALML